MKCNAAFSAPDRKTLLVLGLAAASLIVLSTVGAPNADPTAKDVATEDDTLRYEPMAPHRTPHGEAVDVGEKDVQRLVTLVDGSQVIGWISGDENLSGKRVTVSVGNETSRVSIKPGNVFTWKYCVDEPVRAQFAVGELAAGVLLEPVAPDKPTVFFVIDRPVYRPGQLLHFAGFLRRLDADGELTPIAGEEVAVRLVSQSKKTIAAEVQLTSDAFGRIEGEYRFQDADALDAYRLSIAGYRGTAEMKLAEFRKAKVRLAIDGELDGHDLELDFRAVDFLEKPAPGTSVHFIARILKSGGAGRETPLEARDYALHDDEWPGMIGEVGALPDELRWLFEAGELDQPVFPATSIVAQHEGDLEMGKEGRAEYTLVLEEKWTEGDYRVVVEGVLLDYNGREQRSARSIPIAKKKPRHCDLRLDLDKSHYGVGEKVLAGVRPLGSDCGVAEAKASVVAMKLSPSTGTDPYRAYYAHTDPWAWIFAYTQNDRYAQNRFAVFNPAFRGWQPFTEPDLVDRNLVTAAVVSDGAAVFSFDEPGAYKLVGFAELADGRELKNETGFVVHQDDDLSAVSLELDNDVLGAGEVLAGEIHTARPGAEVLLAIRDSGGVRWFKTLELETGAVRFRQPLPANLRYGCLLEAWVVDGDRTSTTRQFFRVDPTDRKIEIDVKTREIYEPGEEVKVDLTVDRAERVGLVVSVFDQSLLGVSDGAPIDIRDFYLADETVYRHAARDVLRSALGDVTVKSLTDRADQWLRADESLAGSFKGQLLRRAVDSYRAGSYLYLSDVNVLLNFAGVDSVVDPISHRYGTHWYARLVQDREEQSPIALIDLLDLRQGKWQVKYRLAGQRLLLMDYSPDHTPGFRQRFTLNRGGYGMDVFLGGAGFAASGNSFQSHLPGALSGQSFHSHLPDAGLASQGLLDSGDPAVMVRRDFSDSAYWNARVRTDATGRATVSFKLPDSLTNWRLAVTAISPRMHVGQAEASFRTFKPVMVWPMVPRIFTQGDRVELYASVHNRTARPLEVEVSLEVDNGEVLTDAVRRVTVPAEDNRPVYWTFEAGAPGFTQILMSARSAAGNDASLKRLPVARLAAEQVIVDSGFCRHGGRIDIPAQVDLDNAELEITLVPSLVDDLVQSLDYLVEYPHGCVEQTMSRFLPAIKVAQTLKAAKIENRELEERLPGVVEAGIKRLLELQQEDGGWGWHGGSQTHEMMTPYALYGLLSAEKAGYPIPNETALERGLARLRQFIDSMGERQAADRIYSMYVYAHRHDVPEEWWTFIRERLDRDQLSDYAMALSLEMLISKKKGTALEDKLVAALHRRAKSKGTKPARSTVHWQTANFSRWADDRYEVTAAVLKALVAHDPDDALIAPTLAFFATTKSANRWNSTKATAMVIYAVCDYLATQDYRPGEVRTVAALLNGAPARRTRVTAGRLSKIVFRGNDLEHGVSTIEFEDDAPGMMYRAVLRHWQQQREIEPMDHGLEVRRRFYAIDRDNHQAREIQPGDSVERGSYIQSIVLVRRQLFVDTSRADMSYVLVENPKPANCEIVPVSDQRFTAWQHATDYALREDKTAGVAWHHERTGSSFSDSSLLYAEFAGEYVVRPARVELMYAPGIHGHSGTFWFNVE